MSTDLKNKAIVIRDETVEGANTAERVGGWMVQSVEELAPKLDEAGNNVVYTRFGTLNQISNSIRKYDITASDPNGWVLSYETKLEPSVISKDYINLGLDLVVDKDGNVRTGTDWKGRQIEVINIKQHIPNIFNIQCDGSGNVLIFFKTWGSVDIVTPDKLLHSLHKEISIVQGASHYGFPGICAGKDGVLHAFYRKGLYHTGIDGNVMYSFSKDFGMTWSEEVIALKGGDEIDGYFGDWRDAKAIRMSNGKFMLSHTKNYAKPIDGTPPYHVEYDNTKCRTYGIIYSQLADGTLDIANPNMIEIPRPADATFIFGAGGLLEYNNTIYCTAYGNDPNSCWLFKSVDFGLTWETVSKIADGYNENSIAFIGDTMYCIMRNADGANAARVVKSENLGLTWSLVKDLDTYFQGHYALSLGDTIMVAGRAYDISTNIVFMDKFGHFALTPISIGRQGDSSYADICTFENYVHIIYYAQLSDTNWGIFTRKIERNKVLGLSY